MSTLDTKNLLDKAETVARATGDLLRGYTASVVTNVEKDIKIDADRKAHEHILSALADTHIPILSEEDTVHEFGKELRWVVDPLDGSLNFLRGIPNCAVSLGLLENGKPILGVVYDFIRDYMYTSIVGEGAWLNGKPITVSDVREKKDAILMTGFPSHTNFSEEALREYIGFIQTFKKIRLIGSASLSLAYVASGKADAYYEKDIKIWDVAGGLALVEAGGGKYSLSAIDAEGRCTVTATNATISI